MEIETVMSYIANSVNPDGVRAREIVESLEELRRRGVEASGAVGDPDPVLAAQDALREGPADEVVIFEHAAAQARWFEEGLFERAQAELPSPLRMVLVSSAPDNGGAHVVAVEESDGAPGVADEATVEISDNLPRFSPGDLAGVVIAIAGTVAVAVLAAAGPGPESGWGAVSILIAIGVALVNLAHVVGLVLFESVHKRDGAARMFRRLALTATPVALVVNLAILLFA
jgi:hypothetical protein